MAPGDAQGVADRDQQRRQRGPTDEPAPLAGLDPLGQQHQPERDQSEFLTARGRRPSHASLDDIQSAREASEVAWRSISGAMGVPPFAEDSCGRERAGVPVRVFVRKSFKKPPGKRGPKPSAARAHRGASA